MQNEKKYVVYYELPDGLHYDMFPSLELAFIFFAMLETQNNPVLMKRPVDL